MSDFELPFTKKKKRTLEEIQSDSELLRAEAENEDLRLSVEQKRYAFNKMQEAGLNYKNDFGSSLKKLWKWANK